MLYYFLILSFCLLFAYLSWRNLALAVYLVCLFLPTYLLRFQVLGLPANLLAAMIWILFVSWLVKIKFNPWQGFKNIFNRTNSHNAVPKNFRWPIILFLLAATIAVFVSPDRSASLGIWKAYFIEALLFFIVFIYTIRTEEQLKNVIRALSLLVLAIGLLALYQKLTGQFIPNPFWADEATRRVTTFFGYPNANALLIVPLLFLFLANLVKDKKIFWRLLYLLTIILGILTIIWAKSAGGLIALIIGLVFLLIFYRPTRLATLIVILLASLGLWLTPAAKTSVQKIYISTAEKSLPQDPTDWQLRAQQWREALAMLKDRPILGAGLAGYQETVKPYHRNQHIEIFLYPHNLILNFYSELGLLGLIAFIWLIIIFFKTAFNNLKENSVLKISLASAMIALLAHGLVDVPYFKNDLSILFWIIVGLSIILNNLGRGARVVESGALEKR